jgi:hypothetical protein
LGAAAAAWAAIPDAGTGLIHGCYNKTSGALRVIDPSTGHTCASTESALNWNQRGINWRGTWSSTTAYNINDAVVLNGSSYVAIAANTNSKPPSANWNTLALHGAIGPKGATGATGPAGPQGPQGPSAGFSASSDGVALTNGASSDTNVVSLNVPAGSYLVSAKLVPYLDSVSTDAMHCDLLDPSGNVLDQSYATLSVQTDSFADTFGDETISMLAPMTTGGGTVSIGCSDDANSAIMFRNQLAAIQLGNVTSASASLAARAAKVHKGNNPNH